MDFSQFLAANGPMPPVSPVPEAEAPAALPDWPIAIYQAVGAGISGEPFVAYPMVPQRRGGFLPMVRCPGVTAEAARAKALEWIANEAAKVRRKVKD